MHFLNPKTDFAFKKVFGSNESTEILLSFLNAIFGLGSGSSGGTGPFLMAVDGCVSVCCANERMSGSFRSMRWSALHLIAVPVCDAPAMVINPKLSQDVALRVGSHAPH